MLAVVTVLVVLSNQLSYVDIIIGGKQLPQLVHNNYDRLGSGTTTIGIDNNNGRGMAGLLV